MYEAAVSAKEMWSIVRNASSLFTQCGPCALSWRLPGIQCLSQAPLSRYQNLTVTSTLVQPVSTPHWHLLYSVAQRSPQIMNLEYREDTWSLELYCSWWSRKGQSVLRGNTLGHEPKYLWEGGMDSSIRQEVPLLLTKTYCFYNSVKMHEKSIWMEFEVYSVIWTDNFF